MTWQFAEKEFYESFTERRMSMRKRTIRKQVWMTRAEAQDLSSKAKKACMDQSRFMRLLIEGYAPPEAPGEEFYDAMEEMRKASERLAEYSHSAENKEQASRYRGAADELLRIQSELEKKYLLPQESGLKWQ